MRKITLTDEQLKNLSIFLNRVDMKGATEAIAMTELVTAIARAEVENDNV